MKIFVLKMVSPPPQGPAETNINVQIGAKHEQKKIQGEVLHGKKHEQYLLLTPTHPLFQEVCAKNRLASQSILFSTYREREPEGGVC